MSGASDAEHLAYASARGLAIVTTDEADFARLNKEFGESGREHAGIIVMKQQRYGRGEQIRRLRRLIEEVTAEALHNRVEYLQRWGDESR